MNGCSFPPFTESARFPADAGGFPSAPATGDVAGRPVAVANALRAASPLLGPWIEDRFVAFALSLTRTPGFRAVRLLEAKNAGPGCLYVSLSAWDDLAWFRAWIAGNGFSAAHSAARADSERYAALTQARFDFPFPPAADVTRTLARLEGPLLARLAERFAVTARGACFRIALELP